MEDAEWRCWYAVMGGMFCTEANDVVDGTRPGVDDIVAMGGLSNSDGANAVEVVMLRRRCVRFTKDKASYAPSGEIIGR